VIVGANDQPVQSMSDLTDQLEQVGVDHPIKLTLLREDKKVAVSVSVVISAMRPRSGGRQTG
jgi:S1-C subfamily serine protease